MTRVNPFIPSELIYLSLDRSIPSVRRVRFVLSFIILNRALKANSEDSDQTPRCAAFDLGLHCLPMSILWDAWHKWVKTTR